MTATRYDPTTDPAYATWIAAGDPEFPLQNLPYGAIVREGGEPHLAVAIGDHALDLHVAARAGLFAESVAEAQAILCAPGLDALLRRDRRTWRAVRERVWGLLRAGDRTLHDAGVAEAALVPRASTRCVLPFSVAAYVDFYASLAHASNLGRILRPGTEPLERNWRWMPVGYHGRASTVACSGTPVRRPSGQRRCGDGPPVFGPTRALDFELEVGFVTGEGPASPLAVAQARETIFGAVLLCDWSARDVQAWEYRPLGPFLAKSFLTSISPWVVTADALEPFRVAAPPQDPPPLPHLAEDGDGAYAIALDVGLASQAMRDRGLAPVTIARANLRNMYWTAGQQIAHVASNGTRIRAGDLYGTGTVSDAADGGAGSLIEITNNGQRPLALADGTMRAFLADGDEVVMRGRATRPGTVSIGFGDVRGTVQL